MNNNIVGKRECEWCWIDVCGWRNAKDSLCGLFGCAYHFV